MIINNPVFVRRLKPCPKHTKIRPIIATTSKFSSMKKFFLSIFAASVAFGSVAQEAADQPQGSWYLGSADATEVLNIFSSGVAISPTIGYAVADNIVVSLTLSSSAEVDTYDADTYEMTSSTLGLSGRYFLGGNYFVGAGVLMTSETETGYEDVTGFGFSVEAGKYIPVRENWYVTPKLNFGSAAWDFGGDVTNTYGVADLGLSIGFGARF